MIIGREITERAPGKKRNQFYHVNSINKIREVHNAKKMG